MTTALLACGPTFEDLIPFLLFGVGGLIVVKALLYVAFVQAFRYRVAAPIPMQPRQAWRIALTRMGIGAFLIGGTWAALYAGGVDSAPSILVIWSVAVCERVFVWWALGKSMAKLQGRRLVGWTLAGTGIDVATDASLYLTGEYGLASPLLGFIAIALFVGVLFAVGRRASLLNRFTAKPLCRACGYDLTGNLSGSCPECGASTSDLQLQPVA